LTTPIPTASLDENTQFHESFLPIIPSRFC
jgi:hypothetical protein